MKKLIFGLFLIISFISSVSACQYKVNEIYHEVEMGLYDSSGNYVGEPLILSNFSGGYQNIAGCGPLSIIISNPLSFDINVEINFTARHDGIIGWPQEDYLISRAITIKSFSSEQIVGDCPSVGGSRLLEDSIEYVITSPKLLIPKMQEVEKQKEICKICPNEKQCLDDGASCDLPIVCGSNICNPDNKCGTFQGCSQGKKLCNNISCLTPSIKKTEEAYLCDWECASGTIACNGICRNVSSKKIGQEYYCIEECKSGYGKENKCIRNPNVARNLLILFISIILLILGIASYFIIGAINEKRGRRKEKEIIKEAEEKAEKIISSAKNKLKRLNDEIEKSEKLKTELNSLKKGSIEARKIKKELEETNESIQKERIRQEEEIKNTLEAYEKRYSHRFVLDNKGYIRFAKGFISAGIGGYLHRWIYKNVHGKINDGYEIHHKDFNKFNNEINNLEELTPKEHQNKHLNRYR
ncbi:HNH endonuclease [Candidatus Pacearchaeota archaeon]|nr:HNH endonuclease [Candidatus Pacearchaeota archaeon]